MKQILSEKSRAKLMGIREFVRKCGIPEMFMCRFVGIYFLISGIVLQMFKAQERDAIGEWKDYIREFPVRNSILWMIFGFLVLTIVYCVVPKKYKIVDQIMLLLGTMFLAISLVWRNDQYYLAIGISGIVIAFVSHMMGKITPEQFSHIPEKVTACIIGIVALAVTIFISVTTVMHHKIFGTSCYDFGIFTQMFYSLSENFTAITTCERDKILSHFNVHASFIYYLLVPVYALFNNQETVLFVAQAILAIGGVIPVYFIAKNRNFNGFGRIAVCCMYIFYCGICAPCYYDYHENSFLPTLLMWLLYAVDQKKIILLYIMTVLTCIVKEDAPLYVICIGIYFFADEQGRKRLHGAMMTIVSGIYFLLINNWLGEYGDGEMMASTRFGNLILESGDGLMSIVGNVLKNPGYFFSLFAQEKTLLFIVQVMMPLLFLPFMTKHLRRFMLLIPWVIMNLVVGAGYSYAASVGYQYIFGPSCLLIYLAILNVSDMEEPRRNSFVTVSACVCIVTTLSLVSWRASYIESYKEKEQHYKNMEECLDTVPENGRVIANPWFLPHLADRPEIYIFDQNDFEKDPNKTEGDGVTFADTVTGLLDMNRYDFYVMSWGDPNTSIAMPYLEEAGFVEFAKTEDYITIYVSPEYLAANPTVEIVGKIG